MDGVADDDDRLGIEGDPFRLMVVFDGNWGQVSADGSWVRGGIAPGVDGKEGCVESCGLDFDGAGFLVVACEEAEGWFGLVGCGCVD